VKIKEVLRALEQFAPLPLQEGFDNAGLQVGLTETEVSGALLCLDVTEKIVDEAVAKGCNLIVAHHPLIFRKLAQVSDGNAVQRTVMKAIKNDVTIVAMHTNIDNAQGGVNFKIAEKMKLVEVDFFGARKNIQTLNDKGEKVNVEGASGVIGTFEQPLAADDFVIMLKKTFDVECVMCNQLLHRPIKKVAICGGSGAFLLPDAIAAGADAFVTGEMHYHDYFDHEQEIQIAVIGHYQSEQFTNEIFKTIIAERCEGVKCFLTQTNTNPIIYL
jgi:dinuclear metal center protein, YbgI family